MTSDLDNSKSVGDRRRAWAYYRDWGIAMISYCVVMPLVFWVGDLKGTNPSRYAWALLPVLPMALMAWAVWRHWQRVDEFQRDLLLRGLAVGFAVAMIACVAMGVLVIAGLSGPIVPWGIFLAGMSTWGVSAVALNVRGANR